jgi:hypothetical protein
MAGARVFRVKFRIAVARRILNGESLSTKLMISRLLVEKRIHRFSRLSAHRVTPDYRHRMARVPGIADWL